MMSELTLTKPEVLTGHSDAICSTEVVNYNWPSI